MLAQFIRSVVVTGIVAATAVASGASDRISAFFATDGPSYMSLNDSNSVPLNFPDVIDRNLCLTIGLVRETMYQCGDLVTSYTLPAVRVLGKIQAPSLVYNSQLAHPRPLITVDVAVPNGTNVPDSIQYIVTANGHADTNVTLSRAMLTDSLGKRRIQVGWDAKNDTTGRYPATINAKSYYPGGGTYTTTLNTNVIVINRLNSPVGSGWWIGGVEKLHFPSTGVLWVGSDGSARMFHNTATSGVFVADNFDRPDTLKRSGSPAIYERRLPGGAKVVFDALGRHVQTVDLRGFTTTFGYQSNSAAAPLTTITLPRMTVPYTFQYQAIGADTTLDKVLSPHTTGTQTTEVSSWVSVISQIFDPYGADVYYEVDGTSENSYRINQRRGKGGKVTLFAYDKQAHMSRMVDSTIMGADSAISAKRGDVTTICPAFSLSSTIAACGTRFSLPESALVRIDGPLANSPYPDVAAFRLDRLKAPEVIRDAENNLTFVYREKASGQTCTAFPAFVQRTVAPNGFLTVSSCDARGNVASATEYDGVSSGSTRTTNYAWDSLYKMTAAIDHFGDTTFKAIYNAVGNPTQIGDERAGSASLFYYGSGADQNLLIEVRKPVTRGPAIDIEQITYDTLGNPTGAYSIKDSSGVSYVAATHWGQDAIGRPIQSCVDIQDITTSPKQQCTYTTYDVMGRDSVITQYGVALNNQSAQVLTVQKVYGNEGQLARVSREKSGSTLPLYTHYWYDRSERLLSESEQTLVPYPDTAFARTTIYKKAFHTYDAAGNRITTTNRRGHTVTMTYDGMHRLRQKDVPTVTIDSILPDSSIAMVFGQRYPFISNNASGGFTMLGDTFLYTYDFAGRILSATNDSTKVYRTYTKNGLVKTDSVEYKRAGSGFVKYGMTFSYDNLNRRTMIALPDTLTVSGGNQFIQFSYLPLTGELDEVTDPLNNTWNYDYNLRGEVVKLTSPGSLTRTLRYDGIGNVVADSLKSSALVLRDADIVYDNRGKRTAVNDAGLYAETSQFTYSGLGNLLHSHVNQTSVRDGNTIVAATVENVVHDPAGNITWMQQIDTTIKVGSTLITNTTIDHHIDGQWRADSQYMTGVKDNTRKYLYDADGNVTYYRQLPFAFADWDDLYREERMSYYDAEGRLRAADYRDGASIGLLVGNRVFERYHYDALGRRYLVRTDKVCVDNGSPKERCNVGTVRRTIWDGDQELAEIQVPIGAPTDMDDDAFVSRADRIGNGDPNPYFGRVVYINGVDVDQPIGIVRSNYSNRTPDSGNDINLMVIPSASMSLLWDHKGRMSQVWCSNGQARCTGTRENTGTPGTLRVDVPEQFFVVDRQRFANEAWHGTLLEDKTDATRTNFRRNRYYDPASGRFTQEDPIGLAGGLNLYGYAGGDPVNFSDPFGLWPCCVQLGIVTAAAQRVTNEFYVKQIFEQSFDLTMGFAGGGMGVVGSLENMAASAAAREAGGLSAAGRALEKHGSRVGSVFPRATGNAAAKNALGQQVVEDILTSPGSRRVDLTSGRFKGGHDIYAPDGRGVRYNSDGKFVGLLEPPR